MCGRPAEMILGGYGVHQIVHQIELVISDTRLFVFGAESHGAYAEAFSYPWRHGQRTGEDATRANVGETWPFSAAKYRIGLPNSAAIRISA